MNFMCTYLCGGGECGEKEEESVYVSCVVMVRRGWCVCVSIHVCTYAHPSTHTTHLDDPVDEDGAHLGVDLLLLRHVGPRRRRHLVVVIGVVVVG